MTLNDISRLTPLKLEAFYLELEQENRLSEFSDKVRTQILFALALSLSRRGGSLNGFCVLARAKKYARECVALLETLPGRTLKDIAPSFAVLAGISMPNYITWEYITQKYSFPEFNSLIS